MTTAIITLDMINVICAEGGALAEVYSPRIKEANTLEHINKVNKNARNNGYLVIQIILAFNPQYTDGSTASPIFSAAKQNKILQQDSWDTAFVDGLEVMPQDIKITKHRVSGFYGTDLDLILRANKIDNVILMGVATNIAIELTAREAHDRDYKVTIISDATEAGSIEEKKNSLNFLQRICSIKTHEEII